MKGFKTAKNWINEMIAGHGIRTRKNIAFILQITRLNHHGSHWGVITIFCISVFFLEKKETSILISRIFEFWLLKASKIDSKVAYFRSGSQMNQALLSDYVSILSANYSNAQL